MKKDPLSLWFIVKNYRIRSVFMKNFFIILALILLPVTAFSAGIYQLYSKTVTEEIGAAHLISLSRIRDMADLTIREADNLSLRFASSEAVAMMLKPGNLHYYDRNMNLWKLMTEMIEAAGVHQFVDSIYVYSETDRSVLSSKVGRWDLERFHDGEWMNSYERNKRLHVAWSEARMAVTGYSGTSRKAVISLYRMAPLLPSDKLGGVIVNMDADRFMAMIDRSSNDYIDDVFIVSGDGKILGGSDPARMNRPISDIVPAGFLNGPSSGEPAFMYMDDSRRLMSRVHSLYNDWEFVSIAPLKLYEGKAKYIRSYLFFTSLFSIAVAMVLALVVSWRMYTPIRQLISVVNRPWEWLEESASASRLHEIKYITSSIVSSYGQQKDLENELRYRLKLLDRAHAVALQSQINPHFLYNTMETLNWQALRLTGDENPVSAMISSLSRLLRYSLEGENSLVPIREEIEHCRCYIDIQKIRYPRKFEAAWRIDPKIENFAIPKITLQPLIENAIYHGIKPMFRGGLITVSGWLDNDAVMLRVADNGVGMDKEQVERLNREFVDEAWITASNHIGVKNVNQRIKLTFGGHCGLYIESAPDSGTVVTVRIAAQQA